MREAKVDQFHVETSSTLHDDVVGRDVQVNDAAVMQELNRVQHLDTQVAICPSVCLSVP